MILGEDIGVNGGVFRSTEGLYEKYGKDRVVDTPLAESGIIGSAIGLALNGLLPIVEIQFLAFIYPGFEQTVSHAARMRYRTRGNLACPLLSVHHMVLESEVLNFIPKVSKPSLPILRV